MRPSLARASLRLAFGGTALAASIPACDSRPAEVLISPCGCSRDWMKARTSVSDELDLLFVVDGSPGSGFAQAAIAREIPALLQKVTAQGVDPQTGQPAGYARVHVAVISSSLGSHGTSLCAPSLVPHGDDAAHPLPRASESVCTARDLRWSVDRVHDDGAPFQAAAGADALSSAVACAIESVQEDGCSQPAPLEAAYHFLIDPAPYATADVNCTFGVDGDACGNNRIVTSGVDADLLAARKKFLAADSALAVVIVSPHDDASLKPAGMNWLPWALPSGGMQRGWAGCASVPDDFEPETVADFNQLQSKWNCRSCFEDDADANCSVRWPIVSRNTDVDARSVRAFEQTRRYGYNFLWGRQRYVDAFTTTQVPGSDGHAALNPIFAGGWRDRSMIVVQAIAGVPMRLVADGSGEEKLLTEDDWTKLVGPESARDPHMIASIGPRPGIPKFDGDRTVDLNGGDRDIAGGDDLQYACIAPLPALQTTPRCSGDSASSDPVCQGTSQVFAPVYPSLRILRVVHGLGYGGMVGSLCHGVRPALGALADRAMEIRAATCLESDLPNLDDDRVSCVELEAFPDDRGGATCESLGLCTPGAAPCRSTPVDAAKAASEMALAITVVRPDGTTQSDPSPARVENGNVYVTGSDRRKHLACELRPLVTPTADADTANACRTDPLFPAHTTASGWCVSDDPVVIESLCASRPRPRSSLRFVGAARPVRHAEMFSLCTSQ